jgi:protein-L-isoaspartate(D-aspartate) O-methyltransferase
VERSRPHPLVAAARKAGVRDMRVFGALAAVPRAAYVPEGSEGAADLDRPIPIGHAQVTTQPSLVATMVEALALRGHEQVLEVGAGLGYQTALLARLARVVWSLEWRRELAEAARTNLAAQGVDNAHVVLGDGSGGLPDHAPFDAIVVAAAHPRVPAPLIRQLAVGGRLVQPIGPSGAEIVTLFVRAADDRLVRERSIVRACFVPLYGRYGFVEDEDGG